MYVEKFWVKGWPGDTIFDLNFCNCEDKIHRWSLFRNVRDECTARERALFFKLLAVCLGASRYSPQLKEEISGVYGRRSEIAGFGVTIRSVTCRNDGAEYFYRAKRDYVVTPGGIVDPVIGERCPWQGDYVVFNGFNDLKKPFGDFAYGFNGARSASAYQEVDLDFPVRLRSSRFGTFFDDIFPLTPVTAWLNKQHRAASHNSIKAASLYNSALTAFSSFFPHIEFSHCDKDKIVFIRKRSKPTREGGKSSQTILLSDLTQDQINLVDFLIDFIRQLIDSQKTSDDFNLCQGIIFIDHFERLFPFGQINEVMKALENLFPNIHYIN